jgi:hypothetical protein
MNQIENKNKLKDCPENLKGKIKRKGKGHKCQTDNTLTTCITQDWKCH